MKIVKSDSPPRAEPIKLGRGCQKRGPLKCQKSWFSTKMRFPCTTSWNRWFIDCCWKKETTKFDQKSSKFRVQKSSKIRSKIGFLFSTPAHPKRTSFNLILDPPKTTISRLFGPSIFDQFFVSSEQLLTNHLLTSMLQNRENWSKSPFWSFWRFWPFWSKVDLTA